MRNTRLAHLILIDIVTCYGDYRRGLDCWMDLLTTLPYNP
jgi:hypothetical protein